MFFFAFKPAKRWRGYSRGGEPIAGPLRLGGMEIIPLPVRHGSAETPASFSNGTAGSLRLFKRHERSPPGTMSSCEGWTR